ncbi:MAG: hypothetical protein BAA04_06995 [Firmicutes bacterium ZCTH02-B6]|nr:MAG: hypothetical protein BAA04_06995 [Firmicutes bacterium ZCTH02-B6]
MTTATNSTKMQPPRLDELPDVITAEQAAAVLQCTTNHVYALCRAGEIPAIKVGRLVRIHKRAFLAWLEGGQGRVTA